MDNDALLEIRRMVRKAVEGAHPHLDEDRCALLVEAADQGDLKSVHDLLVEGMIKLRGAEFTRRLLDEVDSRCNLDSPGRRLH